MIKLLLTFALFISSFHSFAWGPQGHQVTVLIAEKFLTPKAKAEIEKITGGKPLSSFASWADQARNDPEWNHTGHWHYVDMEDNSFMKSMEPLDIVDAIPYCVNNLKRATSKEDKFDWLKFLIHFGGDLHQPMHVGRPSDRGGNDTKVEYGKKMNLHFLWDNGFIEKRGFKPVDYATMLISKSRPQSELRKPFDINSAVSENLALRKFMYSFKDGKIDQAYEEKAFAIMDERLWTGGLRLASLLNSIYQ